MSKPSSTAIQRLAHQFWPNSPRFDCEPGKVVRMPYAAKWAWVTRTSSVSGCG